MRAIELVAGIISALIDIECEAAIVARLKAHALTEGAKLGLSIFPLASYRSRVEVVIDDGVDAVIADVSYIKNEPPRQRPLDRYIPGFHVGILEALINYEVGGR